MSKVFMAECAAVDIAYCHASHMVVCVDGNACAQWMSAVCRVAGNARKRVFVCEVHADRVNVMQMQWSRAGMLPVNTDTGRDSL